jgi:hypothetical protein
MCLVFLALILSPRIVMFFWWLLDMARWSATFDNLFLPLLGFLILPWTTIMYVLVAPQGITGFDWVWIVIGVAADLGALGGGASQSRD